MFWDGQMYNGRPAELVSAEGGATWGAVTPAANGLVTRGVLLDIAGLRGVPWLEPGDPVFPEDLEAAERRQGVRVEPGDAVLLRTGTDRYRKELPESAFDPNDYRQPGWHAACLPWLHQRSVACIGSDVATDVNPSGYPNIFMPVHSCGIVAMGLWLIDNCDLVTCAETSERLRQWDFHLAICPLRLAGTSGSPVNPIATF
jgi:kynurenine formamidase